MPKLIGCVLSASLVISNPFLLLETLGATGSRVTCSHSTLNPLALSHDMAIGHMTAWKPGSEQSCIAKAMAIKAILNK